MHPLRQTLLLIVALAPPATVTAQDGPVLPPEARVRVTTDAGRFVGKWLGRTADSLSILDSRDEPRGFASASVRGLEVSAGRKRRTGRGALIGVASGAAGGILGALGFCRGGCGDLSGLLVMAFGGIGAGGGLIVGAIVGSQIRSERWESVPVSVGLRLSLP
jgi:hypothetical protein